MAPPRCPVCNRWGRAALGNYCKTCHPNSTEGEKHILDDFHEKAEVSGEFFSKEFGVITDKFGYER